MSQSFIQAECNYDIHDQELFTDHKNLEIFQKARQLTRRQARWALFLSRFDFQITHIPGKQATQPDALSRRPDHGEGDEDNKDEILLPGTLFARSSTTVLINEDLRNKLANAQATDDEFLDIMRVIQAKGNSELKTSLDKRWTIQGGLLLFDNCVCVPRDSQLRSYIVSLYHDPPPSGHPGRVKTFELVQRAYWWKGMRKFIYEYVDGCAICQSTKNLPNRPSTPLVPIPPEEQGYPFSTVSMDFITELPLSNGFDAIAVFVDHDISKAAVIAPCHTTITAEQTASLYRDHVWKRFGLPNKLISDRGTQFTAHFSKELCKLLAISQALSTAYHPQTDGQTERLNQELEQFLRAYTSRRQTDWAEHLSAAEFAHNSRSHSTTSQSPFMVLMGYHPKSIPSVLTPSSLPAVQNRLDHMSQLREDVQAAQLIAHRHWTDNTPPPTYKPGDHVWLEGKNLRLDYPSVKLAPRRYGPFPIAASINPVTFRLTLPPSWLSRVHPVFHASLLSPYRETLAHGPNFTRPPPDLVAGDDEYEVEAIIDSRSFRGKLQYLVKWLGYPTSENQWLPASELSHAADAVASFHLTHPSALSPSSFLSRRGCRS